MNEINSVIRRASFRLALMRFFAGLVALTTTALCVLLVLRVLQQLSLINVQWSMAAWLAPVAVLVGSAVWAMFKPVSRLAVARTVDEGANLNETLSTALHVQRATDPWSQSVVAQAITVARSVNVKSAVPLQAPRRWFVPVATALAVFVVWLMPMPDLFGKKAVAAQAAADEKQVEKTKEAVKLAEARVQQALAKIDPTAEGKKDEPQANDQRPKTPEEIRRSAVKSLTSAKQRVEELKGGVKGQQAKTLQDMLRQLRVPGKGPLAEMAKELAKGNFNAAQKEMQQAMENLSSGAMTDEQKQQTKEQLEKLAEQLKKLADNKADLENKLKAAGIDPKSAATPEQLKAALDKAAGMSEQQKDALMAQAQACKGAGESSQAMAAALEQMADGMSKQGMDQQGSQGTQAAMEQMQQMEALSQDMKAMDAAMAEIKFQMQQMGEGAGECEGGGGGSGEGSGGKSGDQPGSGEGMGQFEEGDERNEGSGQGGGGVSSGGGGIGEAPADEKWQKRKAKTQLGQGPIIASTFIEGDSIKNEAMGKFQEAVEAGTKEGADAIESNTVERQHQRVVKFYFGNLQNRAGTAPKGESKKAAENKPADADSKPAEKK